MATSDSHPSPERQERGRVLRGIPFTVPDLFRSIHAIFLPLGDHWCGIIHHYHHHSVAINTFFRG